MSALASPGPSAPRVLHETTEIPALRLLTRSAARRRNMPSCFDGMTMVVAGGRPGVDIETAIDPMPAAGGGGPFRDRDKVAVGKADCDHMVRAGAHLDRPLRARPGLRPPARQRARNRRLGTGGGAAAIPAGQRAAAYFFDADSFSSLESASTRALSLALYFRLRGFVRRRYPQHGHHRPSHLMNISHIWHRLCPDTYLPVPTGFCALYLMHIPLHVMPDT